ncbi:MAG: sensor histidine kinase, partial [Bacillota bacterium]
ERLQGLKLFEASEKLHQALLNSVSHELRTPLTAILGAASALEDEHLSREVGVRKELIQSVVESSRRLDQVVENLLDMSRLNSGVLSPKRDWVDFAEMIEGLVGKLKNTIQSHELKVDIRFEPCFLRIDERLLEHVILNLIFNAARYSPVRSTISLSLSKDFDRIHLVVSDEGPGISKENFEKIFEAFYRIPGTPAGGMGLGLAIVKAFVEAHGGRVYARNKLEGTGAQFYVELPYETPPQALLIEG